MDIGQPGPAGQDGAPADLRPRPGAPILQAGPADKDLFADLRKVGSKPVTGHGYAWMTDARGCDPGGRLCASRTPIKARWAATVSTPWRKENETPHLLWLPGRGTGLAGCMSSSNPTRHNAAPQPEAALDPLLEKPFVFAVLEHVYRWHFDQSYLLEAGKLDTLEVWARQLHPRLDPEDRSEFAELWIPAVSTRVELKRSDYTIPEMNLAVVDRSFKVKRVTRQLRPPASRSNYQVGRYALPEVRDHLFATRTNRVPMSDNLRTAARKLVARVSQQGPPGSLHGGPGLLRRAGFRGLQRPLGLLGNRSQDHALLRRHGPLQPWLFAAQPTAAGGD